MIAIAELSSEAPARASSHRRRQLVVVSLAAFALVYVVVLRATGGAFGYTLDDPYIHLRLSEAIAHGTYGINLGEPASPSSSILWPILLVPFAWSGLHEYVPLVINVGSATASVLVLYEILSTTWSAFDRTGLARFVVTLVVALSLNWVGLSLTGMEHSTHVLLTMLALLGLVRTAHGGRAGWWFWPAVALAPLIRYEGLAVSAVVLVAVATRGYMLRALQVGIAVVVAVVGFSMFLRSQGLPVLPSSVLAKSSTAYAGSSRPGDLVDAISHNVTETLSTRPVALLFIAAVAAAIGLFIADRNRRDLAAERMIATSAAAVMCAHVGMGENGWHNRYEIYALSFTVAALAVISAPAVERLSGRFGLRPVLGVVCVASLLLFNRYVSTTLNIGSSARSIYDQQHEMHVFVVDYLRAPVAVNDLGEVSYDDPYYVVDLLGLASETARIKQQAGEPHWIAQVVDAQRVPAALVYASIFPGQIPDDWVRVGVLESNYQLADFPEVTVFATSRDNVARVRAALVAFAPTASGHTNVRIDA